MSRVSRAKFEAELKLLMTRFGVASLQVSDNYHDCSAYDRRGNGLFQFTTLDADVEVEEIGDYSL